MKNTNSPRAARKKAYICFVLAIASLSLMFTVTRFGLIGLIFACVVPAALAFAGMAICQNHWCCPTCGKELPVFGKVTHCKHCGYPVDSEISGEKA